MRALQAQGTAQKWEYTHMTPGHLSIARLYCARLQLVADFTMKRRKTAGVGFLTFTTYIHELFTNLQYNLGCFPEW